MKNKWKQLPQRKRLCECGWRWMEEGAGGEWVSGAGLREGRPGRSADQLKSGASQAQRQTGRGQTRGAGTRGGCMASGGVRQTCGAGAPRVKHQLGVQPGSCRL